jgi:hypothetical protein
LPPVVALNGGVLCACRDVLGGAQKRTAEGMATRAWAAAEKRQQRRAVQLTFRAWVSYCGHVRSAQGFALHKGAITFLRRAICTYVSQHRVCVW